MAYNYCTSKSTFGINPTRNINYFSPGCGDPYTTLSYWRRRFCSDAQYLQCYHYPEPDIRFFNSGYMVKGKNAPCGGGLCIGWVQPDGTIGGPLARTKCGKRCFVDKTNNNGTISVA